MAFDYYPVIDAQILPTPESAEQGDFSTRSPQCRATVRVTPRRTVPVSSNTILKIDGWANNFFASSLQCRVGSFPLRHFPRPTETFVRRNSPLAEIGFHPVAHSIWKGKSMERQQDQPLPSSSLWTLFFWIPYWVSQAPRFCRSSWSPWSSSCPNLQIGTKPSRFGFYLGPANSFRMQGFCLIHGIWATMPATAALAISKLTGIPFPWELMPMTPSGTVETGFSPSEKRRSCGPPFPRPKAHGNKGSSGTTGSSGGAYPIGPLENPRMRPPEPNRASQRGQTG